MVGELKVFAGNATTELALRVCEYLGIGLGRKEALQFKNDNTFVRIEENVRECDVFIIQTSCPSVNHNLMELLITIDALRRASAQRITAVLPLYPYGRSDSQMETLLTTAMTGTITPASLPKNRAAQAHRP